MWREGIYATFAIASISYTVYSSGFANNDSCGRNKQSRACLQNHIISVVSGKSGKEVAAKTDGTLQATKQI